MRLPPFVAASALALLVLPSPSSAQGPPDVAMSFPIDGTWILSQDGWVQVSTLSAEALLPLDLDGTGDDDLVVDFGPAIGVWIWANQATWLPLHALSPTSMAVGDLNADGRDELIADLPGMGVWVWDSQASWRQLHPRHANHLAVGNIDGAFGDDVVVNFGGLGI